MSDSTEDGKRGELSAARIEEWNRIVENLYPWRAGRDVGGRDWIKRECAKNIQANTKIKEEYSKDWVIDHKLFLLDPNGKPEPEWEHPFLVDRGEHRGGVYTTYAHIMPALLLKNVIPCLCGNKKNMHVLCMGWKFNISQDCWLNSAEHNADADSDLVIDAIMGSQALLDIKDKNFINELRIENHQRIVVWLLEDKHAFAVGWNIHRKKCNDFQCCVFEINSAETTEFVEKIIEKLPDKLKEFYGQINAKEPGYRLSFSKFSDFALDEEEKSEDGGGVEKEKSKDGGVEEEESEYRRARVPNLSNHIITPSDIGAPTDFPCVPFMARCTMYLSFINNLTEAENIRDLGLCMDLDDEKDVYFRFETCLIEMMHKIVTEDRHCLLVPSEICDKKIININDIYLEEFNPEKSDQVKVVEFFDFEEGFRQWVPVDGKRPLDVPCRVSAHYPSTPALSAIRECRVLIRALMLRR